MRLLLLGLVLVTLSACGSDAAGSHSDETSEPQKATVFDPMVEQLDRAKQAADTLPKERKDNLDEAVASDSN